jgi:carbon monoxide dehydrogenase subunit G
MRLMGQRLLPVDRAAVWAGLNDVDLLKSAITGCDTLVLFKPDVYSVGVTAAIGPVKTRFAGSLTLADVQPPEATTIRFDMHAAAVGFAKGEAKVRLLSPDARSTEMQYDVNASIGGKLAQVGSRLVDAAAATMADRFFEKFVAELIARHPAPAVEIPSAPGALTMVWRFLKRLLGAK